MCHTTTSYSLIPPERRLQIRDTRVPGRKGWAAKRLTEYDGRKAIVPERKLRDVQARTRYGHGQDRRVKIQTAEGVLRTYGHRQKDIWRDGKASRAGQYGAREGSTGAVVVETVEAIDRKSTRLNARHVS